MITLKKRSEFLRLRGGARRATSCFVLEARPRASVLNTASLGMVQRCKLPPADAARFGFTVTKKLGNAVVRNRIKRRLRAICQALTPMQIVPGCDYVVVARRAALVRPHAELQKDMTTALESVNRGLKRQLEAQFEQTSTSTNDHMIPTYD